MHKELANGLKAIMLTIGDQEGMLLPELARVLGVQSSSLLHSIRTHGLLVVSPTHYQRLQLQQEKIIHARTTRINFVPQETVEALVKIVSTPEAWSVYSQLWGTAHAVRTGDIQTARTIVGLDIGLPDPRDMIAQFETALTGWKQALAEADKPQQEKREFIAIRGRSGEGETQVLYMFCDSA